VLVLELMREHCQMGRRVPAVRGQALPGLARPGSVLQGRRADLARGAGGGEGPAGLRLRPQRVPPGRARPRLARPRPAPCGTGPDL